METPSKAATLSPRIQYAISILIISKLSRQIHHEINMLFNVNHLFIDLAGLVRCLVMIYTSIILIIYMIVFVCIFIWEAGVCFN